MVSLVAGNEEGCQSVFRRAFPRSGEAGGLKCFGSDSGESSGLARESESWIAVFRDWTPRPSSLRQQQDRTVGPRRQAQPRWILSPLGLCFPMLPRRSDLELQGAIPGVPVARIRDVRRDKVSL